MSTPETSVVMPVRNAGAHLAQALHSLLAQTYEDFELLLVDDHSQDDAIPSLACVDPRLRILPSQGRGVVQAFATGMQAARGAFVARMDADDVCLPRRLGAQIAQLKAQPELGLVGCLVEWFGEQGVRAGNRHYQDWLNSTVSPQEIRDQLFVECPLPNPSVVFRRSVLEQLGGYRELDWPEDYDLFLRADRLGIAMGKTPELLLRWREHPGRVTHRDPRYSRHNFQRAKAHHLVHGRLQGRELIVMGAGPTGRELHDLLSAEGARVQGFLDVHPRRVGGQKRGLPVWPYTKLGEPDLPLLLGAVGARGARSSMRELLASHGHQEGRDYLFMA